MEQNELLLTRYKGKRPTRPITAVITLKSNLHWCSDVFETPCLNSEVVRVDFSMDSCDREVISCVATSGSINAKLVRDLMFQAME